MNIDLATAVAALREQLIASRAAAEGKGVRFRVDSVNLEVKCTVTASDSVGGGVKFWVVNADGKSSTEESATHTVTLHLSALDDAGVEILTGDNEAVMPR